MKYLYAKKRLDYTDYASGRVLYSLPNSPAFPVRLISEIFQQVFAMFPADKKFQIYDPCCGCAYHLAVLGFLHSDKISEIIASDIDNDVLQIAFKNLKLLNASGFKERILEISLMVEKFGKESHIEALNSAKRLQTDIEIKYRIFQSDLLKSNFSDTLSGFKPDIIFADTPYGQTVNWQGNTAFDDFLYQILENLKPLLKRETVIVIATSKEDKAEHPDYERLKKLKTADRQIRFFRIK